MNLRNLGIRQRVLLVTMAPMLLVALVLVFYFTFLRYGDVEDALFQRGNSMAGQLIPASEYGMFSGNHAELSRLAQAMMKEPDVSGIAFFDQAGNLLAMAGALRSSLFPAREQQAWHGRSEDGQTLIFHVRVARQPIPFDDPFSSVENDARELVLGSITLEMSRERVVRRKLEVLGVSLGSVALMVIFAGMLAGRLGRDLTEPVVRLEAAVRRIRGGEMTTRVIPHQAGTVRALEDGFNEMAQALEKSRRRTEAALASSEAELRKQYEFATALLQALSDAAIGILILQEDRIVFANDAAISIHGYSKAELLAMSDWSSLILPEEADSLRERYERTLQSGWPGERFECTIRSRDGLIRYLDVVTTSLRGDAQQSRVVMVEIDITERSLAEERVTIANRELQKQRDEAERANLAKSRFLAAASHDLRQPLHALSLFCGELPTVMKTAAQHRLANQINAAVGLLVELLDALLDISRLDIHDLDPKIRAVPLMPILEAVALNHQTSAEAQQLTMRVHPSSVWVETDPHLLSRILGNLVSNAVRYTRRGRIFVGVRRQGREVRIEVWDTGIGIPEEHLPHLFQEFYQVENPERDSAKGLGLGLSIVDRLASALKHPIRIRSWPGQGSVFSVVVPLAELVPDQDSGEPQPGDSSGRILLLLRDQAEAGSLAAQLRGWGYQVYIADSLDAVDYALMSAPPDVVICDDDQMETLNAALTHELSELPSVVLLGEAPQEAVSEKFILAGQLSKPLRPARLRALLQHLMEERAAAQS